MRHRSSLLTHLDPGSPHSCHLSLATAFAGGPSPFLRNMAAASGASAAVEALLKDPKDFDLSFTLLGGFSTPPGGSVLHCLSFLEPTHPGDWRTCKPFVRD